MGEPGQSGAGDPRSAEEERSRAERALQESETLTRLAMQAGRMFAFEWNPSTDEVRRSSDCAEMIRFMGGATRSEGKASLERIHPEDKDALIGIVRSLTPANDTYETEYRVIDPNGQIATFRQNARAFFDEGGRIIRLIGMTADITERKRAEATQGESEERFRRVFEEGPLGLALVGMDFRFLKVNNAFCRMVGFSAEELTQMSFVDITYPDDLQQDLDLAGRLFRREVPYFKMQKRYLKKTGEIIWVNLTASLICDVSRRPLYGLAMIEEITEVKRAQEEALARQKLESLGVLTSGIAHDFNNLLGSILADAELAEAELAAGSSASEELQRIKTVAIRGAEIVRELMIYSGQDKADRFEPVDVSRLVEEMLALLKVSISKNAVVKADLGKNLPAARGNAPQIRQIVMNLVINASEAIGKRNGVITVTTSRVLVGQDSDTGGAPDLPEGDYLRLEVSDTGHGMTEEVRTKIFDPFFTTKFAGRGLGLAVVQGIVRDHCGAINLISAPDQGTTFQILLPCDGQPAEHDSSEPVPASVERVPKAGANVLLVEDENTLRLAVSKILRKNGFSVIEASDGRAAIDLLRDWKDSIDLILLDLTIPGISSLEVAREAQRIRPEVKIILTSAYGREIAMGSIDAPQVRGYIRKPFRLADLVQLLRDALSPETNTVFRG